MKQFIRIAFAAMAYILLAICAVRAVTPSGDFVMEQIARDDDGNIFVAGNGGKNIVVYKLDANGNVSGYYRCKREAQDAIIMCMYYNGAMYISQSWRDGEGSKFSIWKMEKLYSDFSLMLQGTVEDEVKFTDFDVDAGGIYLAGIEARTDKILQFKYMDFEKKLDVTRYDTDYIPASAWFGQYGLYVLSEDRQVYLIDGDGDNLVQSGFGKTQFIMTDNNALYWQDDGSSDINCMVYSENKTDILGSVGQPKDIEHSEAADNIAVLMREPDRLVIVGHDSPDVSDGIAVEKITLNLRQILYGARMPLLMLTLAYIAVLAAFVLIIRFIKYKSILLYHTLAAISGLSGLGLVFMAAVVHFQGSGTYGGITLVVMAFAEWLAVMVIAILFLGHIWRNVGIIVEWMNRVSCGDYYIESRKAPDNEFGLMWTALERMCRKLRIQEYKQDEMADYLYQYAPKNFERLFDKESLHDVAAGEMRKQRVTLGMIAIIDKGTLLTGKLQRQYAQYVNELMEILFSQKESEQAIFLQDGSNLENVNVIFKDDGKSGLVGVQYGIGCMEALLGQTGAQFDTKPFMMLHTAEMSCGLAGGSKQVYPYVTSLEMEMLGNYMDKFKNSGAKIVVTGSTWNQARDTVEGRYIGYVSSADGGQKFDLYEIIDACPQQQKLGKLKNRERFAQALDLFYSDDLYLARSAFADILKECPEDGIAGWYVFACDELFNEGDMAEKRHELYWK